MTLWITTPNLWINLSPIGGDRYPKNTCPQHIGDRTGTETTKNHTDLHKHLSPNPRGQVGTDVHGHLSPLSAAIYSGQRWDSRGLLNLISSKRPSKIEETS